MNAKAEVEERWLRGCPKDVAAWCRYLEEWDAAMYPEEYGFGPVHWGYQQRWAKP